MIFMKKEFQWLEMINTREKGKKRKKKIDRKLWALCFIHTDVRGKFFLTGKIHSKRPALHDIRNLFPFM